MSLINDALKRAGQAQRQQPPQRPSVLPMQPVESPRQRFLLSDYALPALLVVALLGGGFFVWTWLKSGPEQAAATAAVKPPAAAQAEAKPAVVVQPSPQPAPPPVADSKPMVEAKPMTEPTEVSTTPLPATPGKQAVQAGPETVTALAPLPQVSIPAPVIMSAAPSPVVASSPPTQTPVPVQPSPPATPVPAVVAPPPKPAFPELKLQGIVFRSRNSSVVINGKTLFEGDTTQGVKVLKVERQGVTVEFNGETKVLNLE